jgi:small subunit ribosomal protein S13
LPEEDSNEIKDEPKDESPKDESPKDEPPKDEPPKDEPPKDEPPKDEPPKDEPPKDEPPKDEPPKDEPPKDEPPKDEPPKDEQPKEEQPELPDKKAEDTPVKPEDKDTEPKPEPKPKAEGEPKTDAKQEPKPDKPEKKKKGKKGKEKDEKEEGTEDKDKAKSKKPEEENPDFKYIVRVANTNVDGNKSLVYGLTAIKGIGDRLAILITDNLKMDRNKRVGDLSDDEVDKLAEMVESLNTKVPGWMVNRQKDIDTGEDIHIVSADIQRIFRDDLNRLKKIRCYRGIRHETGQKVRGQRSRANGRSGMTVGVQRKRVQQQQQKKK